jgi:hypothetical protein
MYRKRIHARLDNAFEPNAPAIHLEFEAADGRSIKVPRKARACGTAPHNLLGEERVEVVNGIGLRRRRIRPTETEERHAPLHFDQHEARFLSHRF